MFLLMWAISFGTFMIGYVIGKTTVEKSVMHPDSRGEGE